MAEVKDSVGAGRGLPPEPLVGPLQPGGMNVNTLTSSRPADLAGGGTFHSTLIQVERVDSPPPEWAAED